MAITKIEPEHWAPYFERFSRGLIGSRRVDYAEIRVLSPHIGAQKETGWLPLRGITYDPSDGVLDISVDGLSHLVRGVQAVYVDEAAPGVIASIGIVRDDGVTDLVEVR